MNSWLINIARVNLLCLEQKRMIDDSFEDLLYYMVFLSFFEVIFSRNFSVGLSFDCELEIHAKTSRPWSSAATGSFDTWLGSLSICNRIFCRTWSQRDDVYRIGPYHCLLTLQLIPHESLCPRSPVYPLDLCAAKWIHYILSAPRIRLLILRWWLCKLEFSAVSFLTLFGMLDQALSKTQISSSDINT